MEQDEARPQRVVEEDTGPGVINQLVMKKISKTIETKEKEHDEMRNNLMQLINPSQDTQKIEEEKQSKRDFSILSNQEWNTLVGIYRTDDFFDPLQVVSRERVRKSLLNGIPANLRGDIWCMLCRC